MMENKPSLQNLEQRLRRDATRRHATLDDLARSYPVSDYPPRSAERRAAATGPGVVARIAWLIGLSGLTTAGVVGLVTLVGVLILPDPTRPSSPILAAAPQPATLGASVRSLVAGLGELEAQMGERMNPAVDASTTWPERLGALSAAALESQNQLQKPIEEEFIALRADLQTAADYIRQQWQAAPENGPTGRVPLRYDPDSAAG